MATTDTNRLLPHQTGHFFRTRVALIVGGLAFVATIKVLDHCWPTLNDLMPGVTALLLLINDIEKNNQLRNRKVVTPPLCYSEEIGVRDDYRQLLWTVTGLSLTIGLSAFAIFKLIIPRMPVIAWMVLIPLFNWACWEFAGWVNEMIKAVRHYKSTFPRLCPQTGAIPTVTPGGTTVPSSSAPVPQVIIAGKKTM